MKYFLLLTYGSFVLGSAGQPTEAPKRTIVPGTELCEVVASRGRLSIQDALCNIFKQMESDIKYHRDKQAFEKNAAEARKKTKKRT